MTDRDPPTVYLPTPAQIARECERIREGWSEREWRVRSAKQHVGRIQRAVRIEIQEPWEDE